VSKNICNQIDEQFEEVVMHIQKYLEAKTPKIMKKKQKNKKKKKKKKKKKGKKKKQKKKRELYKKFRKEEKEEEKYFASCSKSTFKISLPI